MVLSPVSASALAVKVVGVALGEVGDVAEGRGPGAGDDGTELALQVTEETKLPGSSIESPLATLESKLVTTLPGDLNVAGPRRGADLFRGSSGSRSRRSWRSAARASRSETSKPASST